MVDVLATISSITSTITDLFQRFVNLFPQPWIGVAVALTIGFLLGFWL
jgi:hypothetical protein